ncbi:DEAD-domain-containing protein [Laetiporus sulphureus 93-53]|uniref:RNA helicase n=1 Tax=Laetiporus sulphureus 93-53 TaxID=1314785 RepID=A0A165DAV5_9APHY|nr:DEAD-domain-containing protein [Laetiporus sulphureus 93-53]KZT04454.1 DEAD-domain-containing protein [Laetiporus sulphureus 93-53]
MAATSQKGSAKRKLSATPLLSRKRAKLDNLTTDQLPWKASSRPREVGLGDAFDGLLELEEVDNVEVVYEETDAGKVVRFNVKDEDDQQALGGIEQDQAVAGSSSAPAEEAVADPSQSEKDTPFDSTKMLPKWHRFTLHPQLRRALYAQRFTDPTPIQSETLPLAMKGKDIVGVAETGSGKTLAYGLPILHHLLAHASSHEPTSKQRRPVRALILAPTRELALQVSSHLNACLSAASLPFGTAVDNDNPQTKDVIASEKYSKVKGKGKEKEKTSAPSAPKLNGRPLVSVAAVVGGMSLQKQRRILSRGADVLVATPGRLWDIIQEDDELAGQIEHLRFLVLDEADRMIETGHFAEMDNILRLTLRQAKEDAVESEFEAEPPLVAEEEEESKEGVKAGEMQTFVFSATLSKDLQRNLKRRGRSWKAKKGGSALDDLLLKLDFRDSEPAVIDISPAGGVVATLKESRVECLTNDKDAYLYYVLLRYPGRTLVFLSSIDGIRRLLPIMELLQIPAYALHSQLEQRQRLKNLDRFKSNPRAVLLATDVAARGLDIPAVDHVIHYQVPRTADAYVHRNGRTARAMRRGFSLLMCAPDERRVVKALFGSLGRQVDEVQEMPVELYMLDKLKARVQLARQIDISQHKEKKEKHDKNWLREAAEAMEIDLDSDMESSIENEQRGAPSKQKRRSISTKVSAMKAELKGLLAQPLVARGISTRYITSGSVPIADQLLAGEYNETMVGLKRIEAGSDLIGTKKRGRRAKQEDNPTAQFDEWKGFES